MLERMEEAWSEFTALGAPKYRLTFVRKGESKTEAVNAGKFIDSLKKETRIAIESIKDKTAKKTVGNEYLFTPAEIMALWEHVYEENQAGWNVFITPIDPVRHYILLDDIKEHSLNSLKESGFCPSVILESSRDNYQAVVITTKESSPEAETTYGNKLMRVLNERFDGDRRISGGQHAFRLAGFDNTKPGRSRATVRLVESSDGPVLCCVTQAIMDHIRDTEPVLNYVANINKGDATDADIERAEKDWKFYYGVKYGNAVAMAKEKGADVTQVDRSSLDFRVVLALLSVGNLPAAIIVALQKLSPDIAKRHPATHRYASNCVNAAMSRLNKDLAGKVGEATEEKVLAVQKAWPHVFGSMVSSTTKKIGHSPETFQELSSVDYRTSLSLLARGHSPDAIVKAMMNLRTGGQDYRSTDLYIRNTVLSGVRFRERAGRQTPGERTGGNQQTILSPSEGRTVINSGMNLTSGANNPTRHLEYGTQER